MICGQYISCYIALGLARNPVIQITYHKFRCFKALPWSDSWTPDNRISGDLLAAVALTAAAVLRLSHLVTGPPTHSVAASIVLASVVVCNTPLRRNVTHQGQHATVGQ